MHYFVKSKHRPIEDHLKEIAESFVVISFMHVYRELNRIAEKLLKEGQLLAEGSMAV
jgi:hypothetical protein